MKIFLNTTLTFVFIISLGFSAFSQQTSSIEETIRFPNNSNVLEEDEKDRLDNLVEELKGQTYIEIIVYGHGATDENKARSRAKAVYDYLITKNIPSTKLRYIVRTKPNHALRYNRRPVSSGLRSRYVEIVKIY